MRTTILTCDWCERADVPALRFYEITVRPITDSLTLELQAEICDDCLERIKGRIQAIAVRAHDEQQLGGPR